MHPHFPHIFRPLDLRGVRLRNRIAVSAHFAGWWVDRGLPSDEFVAYLEERAKGGVGLFVIGATSPEPGSGWLENVSDAIIPRYRALAQAGHRHGAVVFAQLCHPGHHPLQGTPIIAPRIGATSTQPEYRPADHVERSIDDLRRLIRSFAAAARRAMLGGVDGLELHSHESFLHAQMLNPLWNTRSDEYGGSLENRMRFLVETLAAMRESIGPAPPLGVRLKLDDMDQRGMSSDDYITVVQRLESLRLVDYVSVTGGDGRFHHGPMPRPEGEWFPLVRQLRAGTKLVLMHAGRIATPEMAERALAEGWLDVACMTKTHICDPHFTQKVLENRLDDIRYCTRCLQSCHGKMDQMTCVYNPLTSRELMWSKLEPAERRKRVVIIGAGPAGMEAALTASQRGHEVIVLERDARVGGQVRIGAASPLRRNWLRIAEFYERQASKGLFEVRLNTNATADDVLGLAPDAVIVATGSHPCRMRFSDSGIEAFTVHEVIAGKTDHVRHAVVFDREGSNRPFVAADYLSSRGIEVDFITSLAHVGELVEGMMLEELIAQLATRGVRFHAGEVVVEFHAGNIHLRNTQTAQERTIPGVDALVATIGSAPADALATALRPRLRDVHVIGDANTPHTVEAATFQGARIARLL